MATSALGYQSFYQAQLTSAISASDLTIPLDVVPTPSEGFLVIESTSPTKREIIYYTSKTASAVVCPSGGRGYDGTTASTHTQNSIVIMAPVAAMFSSMRDLFETTPQGWTPVTQTVSSVTYNGNRSYTLTMSADVSATLSPGMRVRTTRTVTAPTQCTSLNGSTQYYNRASASVTGMTFTDDFTVSAWVKLNSYQVGTIVSRYNGTSGWQVNVQSSGVVQISGLNAGAGNYRLAVTFQSLPLNRWVHIGAFLDMSGYSYTTDNGATGSYIMIDGVVVPGQMQQLGTNPTSLIQAGNLELGSQNGGLIPLNGKLAQVAVFSARITPTTIRSYISQGLAGTETSLISAYSFNNSINDLNTTNANNLTANGSAVATNADSPFSTNSFDTETGTLDYGIVQSVATTTVVVQVPVGCTIPTSGGVSAISYSTQKTPYGMPVNTDRWEVLMLLLSTITTSGTVTGTIYNPGGIKLTVPIGQGTLSTKLGAQITNTTTVYDCNIGVSTSSSSYTEPFLATRDYIGGLSVASFRLFSYYGSKDINNTSTTDYFILFNSSQGFSQADIRGNNTSSGASYIRFLPATL